MKIAVLGSGIVGETLADGLLKYGHSVVRASRSPEKLDDWKATAGSKAQTARFADAAAAGDLVILAVMGAASEAVVRSCAKALAGKTVIDATNPIADTPPANGVLQFFTDNNESLMERLQREVPTARFVKAFSCVGSAFMIDPDFGGTKPTMFICGNDADAKIQVTGILDQFGWETEDMGAAEAARAIEPLCMLWCIPGFLHNQWGHAFKLLKK